MALRKPQGLTLQQLAVIRILLDGPLNAAQILEAYTELAGQPLANNYQYIITRRLWEQKYISRRKATLAGRADAYEFQLTAKGRKALEEARTICRGIVN